MSIYWRRHPDLPDVDLPQAIMRPFWHPETIRLDDKQFCISLDLGRPVISALAILLLSCAVLIIAGLRYLEIYTRYMQLQRLNQPMYIDLGIASVLLIVALLGFYLFYRVIQARYVCFRRESHSIYFPGGGLVPRYQEVDYDEFRGSIRNLKNIFGKRQSILALDHVDGKQSILLTRTTRNPQSLAGFWSFIVQYMKQDGPLPDVPALHQYPNRTPGVIHASTVDYS